MADILRCSKADILRSVRMSFRCSGAILARRVPLASAPQACLSDSDLHTFAKPACYNRTRAVHQKGSLIDHLSGANE